MLLQGYLKQARKRTDMFTEEKIAKIFSNIEQIYEFHQEILRQLEECFVEDDPCASEIGSVFLNNVKFLLLFYFSLASSKLSICKSKKCWVAHDG